ncbi:alpha-1,6-mannanase [Adhaeribacter aerolatus]|uniref:Alpha-1,6-mannanase n=1 Tax=Adhaeribacter aerolatus TaxID=670289 RepID=A0A512ASM9_9BACT|nr:glycoside hydrolase family 76 protein [Adhaeribacter aerolatus]GEO02712.1 alpha-1,6-mannanase [Adhaeribacter aerolatus]
MKFIMKRILPFLSFCLFLIGTLQAQPDYKGRIKIIHDNIYKEFYNPAAGLFMETNDKSKNDNPYSYLWPLCGLIQAANEMERLEPAKKYMEPVMKAIQQYYNTTPPAPGYQAVIAKAKVDTRYIDDNQWIGIAYMDAYARTKDKKYLDLAGEIYRFMMTGYDSASGGGLYWRENDKTTKNTCSNGPGIILALQLYQATKQKRYLETAQELYAWTNKYLLAPEGVYYDAVKLPSLKIDSATYTYNTGTMLQSNVMLYTLTKNKKYLQEAQRIAQAAEKHFYRKNKLPDHYWFNAVFLRGYLALYEVDKNKKRLQFIIDDAERVWQQERDSKNLLGKKREKTLIDQAGMLEIYARLANVK